MEKATRTNQEEGEGGLDLFSACELLMKEYGFKSIEDVLRNFTLLQIEKHLELIEKRKRDDIKMAIAIQHGKPREILRQIKVMELVEQKRQEVKH